MTCSLRQSRLSRFLGLGLLIVELLILRFRFQRKVISFHTIPRVQRLCLTFQVYCVRGRTADDAEILFGENLDKLFKSDDFLALIYDIIPSISFLVQSLRTLPTLKIDNEANLIKFGVVCLESISYLLETQNADINFIDSTLNCVNLVFKGNVSVLDSHVSWLCSAVNSLYKVVEFLIRNGPPLPTIPEYALEKTIASIENKRAGWACYQMYILITWLCNIKNTVVDIPKFLVKPIKSIIVSLGRLPLFNSYILIPTKVFKSNWCPDLIGPFCTQAPPLPITYFQEIDVLEEFIYRFVLYIFMTQPLMHYFFGNRITTLGWTSRQAFEENWMCLLSVLCNSPSEDDDPSEINDIIYASSLAVKAITMLLLQTLYHPIPGNTNVSEIMHVSRDSPIPETSLR